MGRLDAVVYFGQHRALVAIQAAGRGEQREWEMSTRSCRQSSERVPGSGCVKARHRCGTEEVPVQPGPTHGPGPRKSDLVPTVWKGELDLPMDRQVLRVLGELQFEDGHLRMVRPQLAQQFAEGDDENVRQCLRRAVCNADEADRTKWDTTLPFSLGSLGLGSALRTDEAAHRASSADCLDMIHNRHATDRQSRAVSCERILGERRFAVLTLESLVKGARHLVEDEDEPSQPRHGWPREAARCAEKSFLDNFVLPAGQTPTERAAGPNVARWRRLSSQPSLPAVCRIDAQPFRFLLCRR